MGLEEDSKDLKDIIRGNVKDKVKRMIKRGEMIGRIGDKQVSIPVPEIDLPHLELDHYKKKGTGQGSGEEGDSLESDSGEKPGKGGEAGDQAGEHVLEVEWDKKEILNMISADWKLPRRKPKTGGDNFEKKNVWNTIRRMGPKGLSVYKRGFKEAIKRLQQSSEWTPGDPVALINRDLRYRGSKIKEVPRSKAVAIYMMDVSGSMGYIQKELARHHSYWVTSFLEDDYDNLDEIFIVHDAKAQKVNKHTFFHLRESGGTKISSAYELMFEIVQAKYSAKSWDRYSFHYTDGDNWGRDDTRKCIQLLSEFFIPEFEQVASIQVKSAYGSGEFNKNLARTFIPSYIGDFNGGETISKDSLVLSFIDELKDIYLSLEGCLSGEE